MKNVNVIVSVDGDIGFRAVIDLDAPKWNGFVNPKVERIKEHCLDEMSECEFDQLVAENN